MANEKDVMKKIDASVEEIVEFIFAKSQENLVIINPDVARFKLSDTGSLLQSGKMQKQGDNWVIEYDAPHAEPIEFGTDAHPVPFGVLKSWAQRKLGLRDQAAGRAAANIQRKVFNRGTDPKPFLRNAIKQGESKFRSLRLKEK